MAKKKVKTAKKFTNLIIVDASGSMRGKIEEVKGGLRKLFADIKSDVAKNPEISQHTIVVDFSSAGDYKVLVNSNVSGELVDDIAEQYSTRSMTALYDAIGKSFQLVPKDQDGVFVTVITDGEENDSKEFTSETIQKLIQDAKDKKWALVFMGCDEKSMMTAANLGFSRGASAQVTNDGAGLEKSFSMSANSRGIYYNSVVTDTSIDLENLVTNTNS